MSIDKSYGKSYRMGGMSMGMGGGSSGAPPGSFGAKFYAVPYVDFACASGEIEESQDARQLGVLQ